MKHAARGGKGSLAASSGALNTILTDALGQFRASTRTNPAAREPYLFRGTVVNVNDGRTASLEFDRLSDKLDPLEMLTGRPSVGSPNRYHNQHRAEPPLVAVLVGQYGTGKTALVSRLCDQLVSSRTGPRPLPVSLGSCSMLRGKLDSRPNAEKFMGLLLEGIVEEGSVKAIETVIAAIRAGKVFLILDALDELVDNVQEHWSFFQSLHQILSSPHTNPATNARVIVTMRREYLTSVDGNLRNTLGALRSPGASRITVYHAQLNSFDDIEIENYLEARLGRQGESFVKRLMEHPELRSVIARPILLRVFADLAKSRQGKHAHLLEIKDVVALIEEYVNSVNQYGKRLQERLGSSFIWDPDLLPHKCLELYWTNSLILSEDDLMSIRKPLSAKPDESEPALRSVHKCPFLVVSKPNGVRFSHKVFFEYFTAKGMADEVKKAPDIRDAKAFNTLVVNPDMRKFLWRMVDDFDKKIEFSCGLHEPQFWAVEKKVFEKHKEKWRSALVTLTRGMTNPDRDADDVEKEIAWLLDESDRPRFDPGYLRYCFQAVGTYVADRRWDEKWIARTQRFSDVLKATGPESMRLIESSGIDEPLKTRHQLLVERILDLCLLLRFEWVRPSFTGRVKESWRDTTWDRDLKARIERIIQGIEVSRF